MAIDLISIGTAVISLAYATERIYKLGVNLFIRPTIDPCLERHNTLETEIAVLKERIDNEIKLLEKVEHKVEEIQKCL